MEFIMSIPASSSQNYINDFTQILAYELPIGGDDSFDRIKACYANLQNLVPDYNDKELEQLFKLKESQSHTGEYQELRSKIHSKSLETLKIIKKPN